MGASLHYRSVQKIPVFKHPSGFSIVFVFHFMKLNRIGFLLRWNILFHFHKWNKIPRMDSEILWEILKFPNFEYYPASCAILEYGTAF